MELEVKSYVDNKMDGADFPDSCIGVTSQNTSSFLDTATSTFSFEGKIESDEELLFESAVSDASLSLEYKQEQKPSPAELKSSLKQSLLTIREIDYSMQFCDLLIKVENLSCNDAILDQVAEQFLKDLKEIKQDDIDVVKVFLDVLQVKEPDKIYCTEVQDLTSFFDHIKNSNYNCKISSENLIYVSKAVKSLLELFCNEELYCYYSGTIVKQPEKNLDMLKNFLLKFGSFEGYSVLCQMYSIGREKVIYLEEEKTEIVSLLIRATKYIGKFIRNFASQYRIRLGILDLQMRSSLEFIVDYFAGHLAEGSVENEEIKSSVKLLEKLIFNFCDDFHKDLVQNSFYDGIYDSDEEEDDDNLVKEEFILLPDNHGWWDDYMKIYSKQ